MTNQTFSIKIINSDEIEKIAPLFDAYRVFYGKSSDINAVRKYLSDRMHNDEVISFLAQAEDNTPAGFINVYPTFSSVSISRTWILNDLFIAPDYRRAGLAESLMHEVKAQAKANDIPSMRLVTTPENENAQKLYIKQGWVLNSYLTFSTQTD